MKGAARHAPAGGRGKIAMDTAVSTMKNVAIMGPVALTVIRQKRALQQESAKMRAQAVARPAHAMGARSGDLATVMIVRDAHTQMVSARHAQTAPKRKQLMQIAPLDMEA